MTPPTNALLISAHGLFPEEQEALNKVLRLLAMNGLQYRVHSDNVQQAHLVVLNDETDSGKTALLKARSGQVKLVFSSSPRTGKNLVSIRRPVSLGLLQEVLSRIFDKMQTQLSTLAPTPAAAPSAVTESRETLFSTLLRAKDQQQQLCITPAGCATIYINGQSKSFATTIGALEFKQIFTLPLEQFDITPLNEQQFTRGTQGMVISALYRLLWTGGVYGSQGQLLAGHKLDNPVKLRAWPNFTRNDFLPQHLKLAAVLARQPTTIRQLVEQTGIGQGDIINFYNAAYAVDLIEQHGGQIIVPAPAPAAVNPKRQGILAKLAAHLKLGS